MNNAVVHPNVVDAACGKEAMAWSIERGQRRDQRDSNLAETRVAEYEAGAGMDSDEEEALAEDTARYFRTVGDKEEAARVAADEGLNRIARRLSAQRRIREEKEEARVVSVEGLDSIAKPLNLSSEIPYGFPPAMKYDVRMSNDEVEDDLLKMTGRGGLPEERNSKHRSDHSTKPASTKASINSASEEASLCSF